MADKSPKSQQPPLTQTEKTKKKTKKSSSKATESNPAEPKFWIERGEFVLIFK
jgi:hypothetical protein